MKLHVVLTAAAIAGLAAACGEGKSNAPPPAPPATVALAPATTAGTPGAERWPTQGGGWQTVAPAAEEMDGARLAALQSEIEERQLPIHGVVVVRHGAIVYEYYAEGWEAEDRHDLYSCTKSVLSMLLGAALDSGALESVDQRVLDLLPEYRAGLANPDPRKQEITLRHLLTMSSGLAWPEWAPYDAKNPLVRMERTDDWARFVLDQPMANDPGEVWSYNGGGAHVLATILQRAIGKPLREYAQTQLFGPLGIADVDWPMDSQGVNYGAYGLRLTPRDLARLGLLYLRGGRWEDMQLVSPGWVRESTQAMLPAIPGQDYGYLWWTEPFGGYVANGYGGQRLIVVPEYDLVVVMTADLGDPEMSTLPEELVAKYVLGAISPTAADSRLLG